MPTRTYKDERRWANTDPSLHFNHDTPQTKATDWRAEYIQALKDRDYDAAELIKSKQMISDECVNGGCEDCYFLWCNCPHHSTVQFRAEHPGLQSLSEIESERDEQEAA